MKFYLILMCFFSLSQQVFAEENIQATENSSETQNLEQKKSTDALVEQENNEPIQASQDLKSAQASSNEIVKSSDAEQQSDEKQAVDTKKAMDEKPAADAKTPVDEKETANEEVMGTLGLIENKSKIPDQDSMLTESLKTIFFLVILLIGFWWAANWLKKSGRMRGMTGGQLIDCKSIYSVGPKEKIIVVKIENEEFLVGVTQNSINLISKLDTQNTASNTAESFKKHMETET